LWYQILWKWPKIHKNIAWSFSKIQLIFIYHIYNINIYLNSPDYIMNFQHDTISHFPMHNLHYEYWYNLATSSILILIWLNFRFNSHVAVGAIYDRFISIEGIISTWVSFSDLFIIFLRLMKKSLWWKKEKFLRLERIYCKKYCYCLVTNLIEMMEVIRMSRKWKK